jgi:UDP-N-acetylmuramoyl-L-alanyl-D-glutamate--2,6-diaminopimelate ligase
MRGVELMRRLANIGDPRGADHWRALVDLDIAGITADSRQVVPGDLFVALPGARMDGRRFIADAVARGAIAVLAPEGTVWPDGVPARPLFLDSEPRRSLAWLAACLAGAQPEQVIAITGTNGKTSTADFIRQLSGANAASLGTLGLIAPNFAPGPGLTTPDPISLAETLAGLARAGIKRVAMEASSHGLDQCRLDGVRLVAGGFTNLTRDHLDYHGNMAAYRAAKLRLFAALLPKGAPAVAMGNIDPETRAALTAIAADRGLALRLVGEGGDLFRLLDATPLPDGQALTLELDGARREVTLPLPGRFQADNALLAAGLLAALGDTDPLSLLPGLMGVRGRLERAAVLANGAAAYVDYAHTSDALNNLLRALRPHTTGRLVLVFGAGGDRDRGKRPLMGMVAAELADIAIVTDDNPRSEDPASIRAAIRAACPNALDIGDRARAIAAGLNLLRAGDILAIAGKGHEQGQIVGDTELPFDDVSVVRRLVAGGGPA